MNNASSLLVLPPVQDTIVEFGRKDGVFAQEPSLTVQIGSHVAYLRFQGDLGGRPVKRAKLRLFLLKTSRNKNARYCAYLLDRLMWDAQTFCWADSPVNEGTLLDTFDVYYAAGPNCWYEADVSEAFAGKSGAFDFTVRLDSETYLKDQPSVFASLEAERCRPELVIEPADDASQAVRAYPGEDGYDLWLRYRLKDAADAVPYRKAFSRISLPAQIPHAETMRHELRLACRGMLGLEPQFADVDCGLRFLEDPSLPPDGFRITGTQEDVVVAGRGAGYLYGMYRLLSLVQRNLPVFPLSLQEAPFFERRVLNNWEDYDQTVERGYAGGGIWDWKSLPGTVSCRYRDYARVAASLSINCIILNNVNPEPDFLQESALGRIALLSDIFRAYGIRFYLNVSFDSPRLTGGLSTADPLLPAVRAFWQDLAARVYEKIPDFGGFVIKGDSEGQPGPLQYGRSHTDGANCIADALRPYGGTLLWRAFVYRVPGLSHDRACQACEFFRPLDGAFRDNVILQIKNGPMDFQVSEPVSSLFFNMPRTSLGMELQTILEYKGQTTHLCFHAPEMRDILNTVSGGRRVADICRAEISSPVNIGTDRNWTRYTMAQANLFAYGRLAFCPEADMDGVLREWAALTFGPDPRIGDVISDMLLSSYRIYASYTAPLGMGYMTDKGSHFHPEPELRPPYNGNSPDGLGYARNSTGSGYAAQYGEPQKTVYDSPDSTPDAHLLFFHHLPFSYRMRDGRTLMQSVYDSYAEGTEQVRLLIEKWKSLQGRIDEKRYREILRRLQMQRSEAGVWRSNCLTYFSRLSGIPDAGGRALAPASGTVSFRLEHGMLYAEGYPYPAVWLVREDTWLVARYADAPRLDMAADGRTGIRFSLAQGPVQVQPPAQPGVYAALYLDKDGFFARQNAVLTVPEEERSNDTL